MRPFGPVRPLVSETVKTRKRDRHRAALLYASSLLWQDDSEMANDFQDELKALAIGLLRRAGVTDDTLPSIEDIEAALLGNRKITSD